jgi:hypothetical protein
MPEPRTGLPGPNGPDRAGREGFGKVDGLDYHGRDYDPQGGAPRALTGGTARSNVDPEKMRPAPTRAAPSIFSKVIASGTHRG